MKPGGSFKTLPFLARLIIVLFAAAGVASIAFAIWYQPVFNPIRLLLLLALAAGSARYKARLYRETTISLLTAVVMVGIIADGPAVSILAAICGVTVQTVLPSNKFALHRLVFNIGMIALTVSATWWTHQVLAGASYSLNGVSVEVAATVLASFVYFFGNSMSVALIISATQRISLTGLWTQHFMYSAPSFIIAGLLSLGLVGLVLAHAMIAPVAFILVTSITYYCAIRRAVQPVIS